MVYSCAFMRSNGMNLAEPLLIKYAHATGVVRRLVTTWFLYGSSLRLALLCHRPMIFRLESPRGDA